ncbi:hypothetical protein BDN70DRAFT_991458 [Pholiota conissans]|uniref:Uncharacterized protein n=1 Tax=Pholiota conissans TaxID=109636 RepID=A0A9P5Z869_9AGAR|nr:hypothetical protein BDN70DRAFT_991458 [Pholiota conissans]
MSLFPEPAPSLPPFSSLLIAGPYHPSAPVHLAFTSAGPKSPVLLLCPDRAKFNEEMVQFNDHWLNSQSGTGKNSKLTSYVSILYPPTPVHLSLLLSMFHVPGSENVQPESTPKTALAIPPNLVILADLSRYFLDVPESSSNPPTLSSYMNLVNRVFVSMLNMTSGDRPTPKFALFDSRLDKFKLPLTAVPSRLEDDDDTADQCEAIVVLPLVEKLFEWIGIFEDDDSYIPSSQGEESSDELEGARKQLRLYRHNQGGEDDERKYHWVERRCKKSRFIKSEETEFVWEDTS